MATVTNPATLSSVRSTFGPGYTGGLTPPTNLAAYTAGTAYVPLGYDYSNISQTAAGLRLSQFNGKEYPPTFTETVNYNTFTLTVISVAQQDYSSKFATYYNRGYLRSSFGAINSESFLYSIGYTTSEGETFTNPLYRTMRACYFDSQTSTINVSFMGDLRTMSGNMQVGRHTFSWSGGGSYYNGGSTATRWTSWSISVPSDPFNAAGTLAEVRSLYF